MLAIQPSRSAVIGLTLTAILGVEAIRVFTTHTLWVLGENTNPNLLGLVALGGFAAAILA